MRADPRAGDVHKGLLMTFAPKAGHESDVEQFLRGGREIVEEEDGTLAWFALKFEDGRYGIFDVFPDQVATRPPCWPRPAGVGKTCGVVVGVGPRHG